MDAMRRLLGLLSLTAAVLLASVPQARACQTLRVDGLETTLAIMAQAGRPNYIDGRLICEIVADLRRHSPTFVELLSVLTAAPQLHVLLSASTDPRRGSLIGRTRFSIGPDATTAFVELFLDRRNILLQRESVAHELAHVAEVVCLGLPGDASTLRLRLDERRGRQKGTLEAPIETTFAVTVGRVVEQEAAARSSNASRFAALARKHGLEGCPSTARETPMLASYEPLNPEPLNPCTLEPANPRTANPRTANPLRLSEPDALLHDVERPRELPSARVAREDIDGLVVPDVDVDGLARLLDRQVLVLEGHRVRRGDVQDLCAKTGFVARSEPHHLVDRILERVVGHVLRADPVGPVAKERNDGELDEPLHQLRYRPHPRQDRA